MLWNDGGKPALPGGAKADCEDAFGAGKTGGPNGSPAVVAGIPAGCELT